LRHVSFLIPQRQLLGRFVQVTLADYVVTVKDRSGLVSTDGHRHTLWDALRTMFRTAVRRCAI